MTAIADAINQARRELEQGFAREEQRTGYRDDPVAYSQEVLRFDPWSKQRDVLESVRDHARTAVRSCHGAGKTAIAARAGLWFLDSFPSSRVITTAPTWHQVKDLLWREVQVAYHNAGTIQGKLSETRLDLGPDWFAIGLSTDKPERFQGHHAEHLLLIVDEASGVDQAIFEAAQGFLTTHGARLLLIGNPTQLAGEFFDAFHTKRVGYNTISISAYDTPAFTDEPVSPGVLRALPTVEWVDEMRALYGEESPLWQVRVLGEFPTTSDDSVIALSDLERAHRFHSEPGSPVVVACDVARFGSDETVIAVRENRRVRIAAALKGHDTMQVVGAILRVAREARGTGLDWPVIVIDDVGVGGGVTDRLNELRQTKQFGATRVVAFNGANKARQPDDYPNRRSELWFQFAEEVASLDLDEDEQLAADLLSPKYRLDSAGRRVVEAKSDTKKRLGRSPDRADAVLMTLAAGQGSSFERDQDDEPGASAYRPDEGRLTGFQPGMSL